MKRCSKCGQDKPRSDFYLHPTMKDGLFSACKTCQNEKQKKYYEKNKDERTAYQRDWNKRNKEYYVLRKKDRKSRYNNKNLTKEDRRYIKGMYRLAKFYGWITGSPWHVDHIVPLKGKTVCGLHVPSNLELVPAVYNQKKGNKFSD